MVGMINVFTQMYFQNCDLLFLSLLAWTFDSLVFFHKLNLYLIILIQGMHFIEISQEYAIFILLNSLLNRVYFVCC